MEGPKGKEALCSDSWQLRALPISGERFSPSPKYHGLDTWQCSKNYTACLPLMAPIAWLATISSEGDHSSKSLERQAGEGRIQKAARGCERFETDFVQLGKQGGGVDSVS